MTSRHTGSQWVLAGACLAVLAAPCAAAPVRYVKKDTARATYEASLEALKAGGVRFGPWHYLGPIDRRRPDPFAEAFAKSGAVNLEAPFPGAGGKTVRWLKGDRFRDGQPNSLRIFDVNDQISVYLHRTITSDLAQQLPVLLGSDDTIAVWLNGRKLLDRNVTRACRLGDERLMLALKPGANEFLMRVQNGGGPSGFAFGQTTASSARTVLLQQIARDFPPAQWQPMLVEADWFRQDGLTKPDADFKAAAAKALDLAKATLAFVGQAGVAPDFRSLQDFGSLLKRLEARSAAANARTDWHALYLETRRLRRRMILSHPTLAFDRLLINKRPPPGYSHMCDQYLGRHNRPGPGLTVLDHWKTAPTARPLVSAGSLPAGTAMHPDLAFDGTRVVFAFSDAKARRFHLYEAGIAGSSVRQLTGAAGADPLLGAHGRKTVAIEDFDPCYLPDGGIAFVSTRNQGFGRCHGGRYTPSYVLYRADADGANIRRLSFGEANEWEPAILHDGRIIYSRWDYINRHDTLFQSLWVTRPDGTGTAHYYGNYSRNPCMLSEAKAIPGSDKVVATACAHHAYTAGSIIVVDPDAGQDGPAPLRRVTPEARFPETEGWSSGIYATPWPLNEDLFLAAYSTARLRSQGGRQADNAYAIYLVDTLGGRELIYRDFAISCFAPIPLRPRRTPPVIPSVRAAEKGSDPFFERRANGTFFVADVYQGTQPLKRGTVKRLRVVEMMEQPTARVPGRSRVANEIIKRVVGTAPVSADGSVAFRAPADVPLLFHLLDENDMALMIMRSQVYVHPGETIGCIGCHEPRNAAPPVAEKGVGSRLPVGPSGASHKRLPTPFSVRDLAPPPGPRYPGGFSFARTVQPVLDRCCIRCHGLGHVAPPPSAAEPSHPGAGAPQRLDLLGTPAGGFNQAYNALLGRRGLVSLAHRNRERDTTTPRVYGAHAGRLAPHLLGPHKKHVTLDRDSWRRLVQWLDLNGQYYGDYSFRRAERRTPDAKAVTALREHVSTSCNACHAKMSEQALAALVNVAAPDESRVLMAPLATRAGGWGQCKQAWTSTDDDGYKGLRRKVLAVAGATGKP